MMTFREPELKTLPPQGDTWAKTSGFRCRRQGIFAYDVPYYGTGNARITEATEWSPRRDVTQVVRDIYAWIVAHERDLASIGEV